MNRYFTPLWRGRVCEWRDGRERYDVDCFVWNLHFIVLRG
jgi:hypothetical protein